MATWSWKALGCDALVQNLTAGIPIPNTPHLDQDMLDLAQQEAQRRRIQTPPQDIVNGVLQQFPTFAAKQTPPPSTNRIKGWLSKHTEPAWKMFAVHLTPALLQIKWQEEGYGDLDAGWLWSFVSTPEFEQHAKPLIKRVMRKLQSHYTTTDVLHETLLQMIRGAKLIARGDGTAGPHYRPDLLRAHPLWMMFIIQIVREIERRDQRGKRKPTVPLPTDQQGRPLDMMDEDSMIAPATEAIRARLESETDRLQEPYKGIFRDLYLPAFFAYLEEDENAKFDLESPAWAVGSIQKIRPNLDEDEAKEIKKALDELIHQLWGDLLLGEFDQDDMDGDPVPV
jgi:hypothetical protein